MDLINKLLDRQLSLGKDIRIPLDSENMFPSSKIKRQKK